MMHALSGLIEGLYLVTSVNATSIDSTERGRVSCLFSSFPVLLRIYDNNESKNVGNEQEGRNDHERVNHKFKDRIYDQETTINPMSNENMVRQLSKLKRNYNKDADVWTWKANARGKRIVKD